MSSVACTVLCVYLEYEGTLQGEIFTEVVWGIHPVLALGPLQAPSGAPRGVEDKEPVPGIENTVEYQR